jgi:tRNA G18 (ribose-2'-O)-methylase SpoU
MRPMPGPSTNPPPPAGAGRQLGHGDHVPGAAVTPVCLLAHDLRDAANVGSLFRIADAFALSCVHLTGGSPRPPDARLRRAARATESHVPWTHEDDPLVLVARLRAAGWRIVALELTTASQDVRAFAVAPGDRVCLVVGAEDAGVAPALLAACDAAVHVPMRGRNSSMNVAVATGIAVHEIAGRRVG